MAEAGREFEARLVSTVSFRSAGVIEQALVSKKIFFFILESHLKDSLNIDFISITSGVRIGDEYFCILNHVTRCCHLRDHTLL